MGGSGGGGGGGKSSTPQINTGQVMQSAQQMAAASVASQMKAMVDNYPRMERLQLGSIGNIGNLLSEEGGELFSWQLVKRGNAKKPDEWRKVPLGKADPNLYTGKARQAVEDAIASREPIRLQGDKLAALGDSISNLALQNYLASPNRSRIETELQRQAEEELFLGRRLSPEQIRESQQAARASMAARGLGTSAATTAAEILNRDMYASAREADRRTFAGNTNQLLFQNEMAQRDQAAQQAALGAQLTGNAANLYQGAANIGLAGGQALIGVDPKMRAINPGITMGSNIQSTMAGMITPTYQSAFQMAGDIAGYNANAMSAMQGARMSANASRQAGQMGMWGGIGSGLLSAAGSIGSAAMMAPAIAALSDKREKKDIKPLGKTGSILGLKAYSFKYKGEDEKHVGFMAQDVKKVLPEAVTEVNYKGKKRLAIKPEAIGAALAEELAQAKAA